MKTRRDVLKLSVAASASLFMTGCGMDGTTSASSDASPSTSSLQQSTAASLTESGTQLGSQSTDFNLTFNESIDTTLFTGDSIKLKDQSGYVSEDSYDVRLNYADSTHKTVNVIFRDGYRLQPGWKYTIEIQPSAWFNAASNHYIDFITAPISPFENLSTGVSGSNTSLAADAAAPQRTQIIVISDIHMNDARSTSGSYGWFNENSALLTEFLQYIRDSLTVSQLVIAGDLFDNWVVPLNSEPYDSSSGITDDLGYFQSVASNPVNSGSVAMINQIADAGNIKVVYVPGNHDMLFTEDICKTIFPNVVWAGGNTSGWGVYEIGVDIVIEHGHRFDFNNAPMDPNHSYQSSLIPPGYFIARLAATNIDAYLTWWSDNHSFWDEIGDGIEEFGSSLWSVAESVANTTYASPVFVSSYYAALEKLIPFDSFLGQYYAQCNGFGGFSGDYKLQSVANSYSDAQIDNLWPERQVYNGLTEYQNELQAILNGTGWDSWGDLYNSSFMQYSDKKVVVVGHTHGAQIKRFPLSSSIFANSGTWIDQDLVTTQAGSQYETATYICIDNASSNGSEVHTVTLYKYESDGSSANLISTSVDATSL